MARLTQSELQAGCAHVPEWQLENGELVRNFTFVDFNSAMIFVNKIGREAEAAGHHPDIDIRYNRVRLALISHDEGGITQRDLELATAIDATL